MKFVLKLVAFEGYSIAKSEALPQDGAYLRDGDVEAHDGRGEATWTRDITQAKTFDSAREAHEFWRRQSTKRPWREDGEANRPLTAFSMTIQPMP